MTASPITATSTVATTSTVAVASTARGAPPAFPQHLRGSRRHRLTGQGAFEAVFQCGRRQEGRFVQLVWMPARGPVGRVGYVVGKKALPLAVDRNRVKRMLRPIVRAARPQIDPYDLIVRLKRPCGRAEFKVVAAEATRLLARLPVPGTVV
ncbi:MAG: ribonuclease P protein component [Casimicrobiaceae bacterium]